ncbi:MAG: class I SAM-dependent methyltransferase [Vulcanisaeta sp.]|nr:class I SAM-dependent methyltransferase [Vulcanisaeta sp.]
MGFNCMERLREVRDAYDVISRAYSTARETGVLAQRLLGEVGEFLRSAKPRVILDIGAGSGGNLRVMRSFFAGSLYIGCELSLGMIMGSGEDIPWINCSGTHLPIRPGSIDLAVSLAVLHHVPRDLVTNVLHGVKQSLKVGGLFTATVWGCVGDALERLVDRVDDCEGYVPWSYGLGRRVLRYYRLYREGELEREVTEAGLRVVKSGIIWIGRYANYYIVAVK